MTVMPQSNIPPLPKKRRRKLLFILFALLGAALVAIGVALWWFNRPIQATVLTSDEKLLVAEKLAVMDDSPEQSEYIPGEKEIVFTERELNGLLNENTALGEQLKLELATNAVHARIQADIPKDSPFLPGKTLRGKARFMISSQEGHPSLILDDVTIWGVSLPNAWLGDFKGKNLLGALLSSSGTSISTIGIEDISVSNGRLTIQLTE